MTERDREVLRLQIGRPMRATSVVLRRCSLGLPIVVKVPPILDTGVPFPTLYWLTCPLAHRRIARIEGQGGVRAAQDKVVADPELWAKLQARHIGYAAEREALLPLEAPHRPSGGVGGTSGSVKCLHAHYADFTAGNDNPIGRDVHALVGDPCCEVPCVSVVDGAPQLNPNWREPSDDDERR
ncbi:MAG: DUF501 domain-containing protein [Polyangiales bacterium]